MKDLGIKLHPVKKLQLWEAIKKVVFAQMDKEKITPERADEILGTVEMDVVDVETPEQAKEVYTALPETFPELAPVTHKFEMEEAESLDKLVVLLLDEVMKKQGVDVAGNLMEEIQEASDTKKLIDDLELKFPEEIKVCVERLSKKVS